MFTNTQAFSSFSVDDLDKAKEFYGKTLGIKIEGDDDMGFFNLLLAGETSVMVYPKEDHKPAGYTILNFMVDDIDDAVKEVKSQGIKLEHYDIPDMKQDKDDIFRAGSMSMAWFTDPAGNVLSLLKQ